MIDLAKLGQLKRLHDDGVLSDPEFAREKAALLSSPAAAPVQSNSKIIGLALLLVAAIAITAVIVSAFAPRPSDSGAKANAGTPEPQLVEAASPEAANEPSPVRTQTSASIIDPPAAAMPSAAALARIEPYLGKCRMDDCSWGKELARTTVRKSAVGTLIRVTLLGGSSVEKNAKIEWDERPHYVWVFCSLKLPSTIIQRDDGSWQVDVLDLASGPPGMMESSQATYYETCPLEPGQSWENVEAIGYRPIDDSREDVSITRPEEIFDHASF